MGFPRQEYWSGLPFPPPGDLPDPGIEPSCPVSPALGGRFFTTEPLGKPPYLSLLPPLAQICAGEEVHSIYITLHFVHSVAPFYSC